MSSPPQLAFETIYHIWNRGVNRQSIFLTDENYRYFLKLFAHHVLPVSSVLAYCLLPNHFHFVVRILDAEQIDNKYKILNKQVITPSQAFSNFFNSYVKGFNKWANRTGGLFEGRFGRKIVKTQVQLSNLLVYVHQNPERHGLTDDFRMWRYSSFGAIVSEQNSHISKADALAIFGDLEMFVAGHETAVDEMLIEDLLSQ